MRISRWDKGITDEREKQEEERENAFSKRGTYLGTVPNEERKRFKEQAQALLSGQVKWRPGWEDLRRDGRAMAGM